MSSNKTNRSASTNIVEQLANKRAYLQHRQRVLTASSRVDTRKPRSKSAPRVYTVKEDAKMEQIHDQNLRLLKTLVTISQRKTELGPPSSSGRSKSCSRSSTSSASTANNSRNSIPR
ncbi:hypothetical protein M3Y94_00501600 [Aphelenchoides besseyi]|nr:hypothetical protein M3Y94_00501600 [Aphelenchoides besseyi]KAI6217310.1 hypothetical protein M3Y95_01228200 [Aphelenchoides besseyi]